jgi:hypothetical protein
MPSIEQLIQSIDGRIRELNGELASLQDARSALVSNGSAASPSLKPRAKRAARQASTRAQTHRAKRAATRKPTRRTAVLLADTAERMLAEGDGLTTGALAEQARADRDQVLTLLRELEAARRVRRAGERRGTRWYAITDEDRIRERAAELASRTKRRRK